MSDEPERLQFRRRIDAEGFALVYHVLTLDRELGDGAFRLYALLLKYARQDAGCWPGVERLAADLGKGERTISRDLAELVDRGLITRERRYGHSSMTWIEDLEVVYHEQLKNEPFEQPCEPAKNGRIEQSFEPAKNGMIDPAKNGMTEEQTETNKQHDDVVSSLVAFGVDGNVARKLATTCTAEQVDGWLDYARNAKSLTAPVAFVVSRLQAGEPAPRASSRPGHGDDDPRRFIDGEFAEFIEY